MTEENRRENVRLELERAETTVQAVEVLNGGGFWAEVAARTALLDFRGAAREHLQGIFPDLA